MSNTVDIKIYQMFWSVPQSDNFVLYPEPQMLEVLQGLQPEEVVFIGNDMYNDIMPAYKTGSLCYGSIRYQD
jgi:hypothetical protein